jgi:hypothetical protein
MNKMICCAILIILVFPENAHAYLNPGTSNFILQLLLAAFLGGILTVKIYWQKLKDFFKDLLSARQKKQ